MKQLITKSVLVVSVALGMTWQAGAHLVNPNGDLVIGYNDTQQTMDGLVGMDVNQLWSWNLGDSSLSGSGFNIVYSADMLTATLSWNLTGMGSQVYAVAWKDGTLADGYSANLGFYWSAVTDSQRTVSDGDTLNLTIDLSPAFKNPTAWSHIAFYGTGGGTNVPDGGTTLALIGVAITGLGLLRRKLS